MPGVLLLTSGSGPSGAIRTATLAAAALAGRTAVTAAHVGTVLDANTGVFSRSMNGGMYLFGKTGSEFRHYFRHLRSAAREIAPDVIHAVGPLANRVAALLCRPGFDHRGSVPCATVASGCDRPGRGLLGWWTRRTVRGADRVIARTEAEASRYRAFGVVSDQVVVIPPFTDPPAAVSKPALCGPLEVPGTARLIMAAGGFDAVASLKDAVWAFDVLKYTAPDLHLVLAGDGPEGGRCVEFGRAIGGDDYRVRYVGVVADGSRRVHPDFWHGIIVHMPDFIGIADVVWVTHRFGGVQSALEAMAAGRPVVAVNTPDLAEIVVDGVTGVLVPVGDPVALAAATADLLARPDRLAEMGEAGRRAAAGFSVRAMAERFAAVYDSVIPPAA